MNWGSFLGVLGGRWWFLTGDLQDMVILDVLDDLILPQGRYPESFVLISLLEVCQEGGVLYEGTWRMLRVPDWRLGGHGHPWRPGWSYFTPRKMPWNFLVNIFIGSVSRRGQVLTILTNNIPDSGRFDVIIIFIEWPGIWKIPPSMNHIWYIFSDSIKKNLRINVPDTLIWGWCGLLFDHITL